MTAPGVWHAAPDGNPADAAAADAPGAEPVPVAGPAATVPPAAGLPAAVPPATVPAPVAGSAPGGAAVSPRPGQAAPGWRPAGIADPDAGWQRLSPRSLVVRPLTDLMRLLPLVAGLLLLHSRDGGGVVWGVAAAVLAVVTGVVHWLTTRYLVTDERVYLRHGLLSQKRLSVARDRIRTVDITAHPLHRLLGVCRISIGTGRNDLRSGESFRLDGLTRADAEALRAALLAGPPAQAAAAAAAAQVAPMALAATAEPAGGAVPATVGSPASVGHAGLPQAGDQAELARLRLRWLGYAPLTLTGLVVLGVLFGAVVQLTNDTNVNLATTGPVRMLVADYAALSVVQRVLVGAATAMACYVLIAIMGYIAVYWNFRLARTGMGTIRVTRGLLSLRATTISLSRLRGVEISESLLLRAVGGARCTAITTGLRIGEGAEREGSALLPPAPGSVVRSVAATVLGVPEQLCSGPLVRHGQAARRRRYLRAVAGAAVLVLGICLVTWSRHGPDWVWIASFALLPAACLVAADRYRNLGHRLSGGWLIACTGSLSRRRSIIGTDAIIGWRIHQTWFQRRLGLMTLTATTAAGHQRYSVHDVPVATGLAVAAAATPALIPPFLAG